MQLLSFFLTCVIIESTPGPNMGYLAILSMENGRRAGFFAVAGVALGLLVIGVAASLGLTALIINVPVLYEVLRWAGVFYLLWLAWLGWRGEEDETSAGRVGAHAENIKYFKRGLITNLLNPKAGIFYVAVLPGFVNPAHPVMVQTVMLTLVFVFVATSIHASVVALAGSARVFLEDQRRLCIARRVLSLLLAGVALWFGWSTGYKSL